MRSSDGIGASTESSAGALLAMLGGVTSLIGATWTVQPLTVSASSDQVLVLLDGRQVAERLGIPHYVLDYESRFRESVIEDFAEEWASGFVSEAFDPKLSPLERLDYMVDAAYFWQKAAKDIEGRMPGCPLGNLALEVSTQDDVLRAKLGWGELPKH